MIADAIRLMRERGVSADDIVDFVAAFEFSEIDLRSTSAKRQARYDRG